MSHAQGVALGDGETVGEGVGVGLLVTVGVGEGVGLFDAVGVGEGVGVGVGEAVAVVTDPVPGQVCDRRMPELNDGLSSA